MSADIATLPSTASEIEIKSDATSTLTTKSTCNHQDYNVPQGFAAKLYDLLKSGTSCDLNITLDDASQVPVHRIILSVASPVFAALMSDPFTEEKSSKVKSFALSDVTRSELDDILRCVYTDTVALNITKLPRLLELAVRFQLTSLLERCINFLEFSMKPTTIFEHIRVSRAVFGSTEFCMRYLSDHALEVLMLDAFLDISGDLLAEILRCDTLRLPEGALFSRLLSWAKHALKKQGKDSENADLVRAQIGPYLAYIRLSSMDLSDIMVHLAASQLFNESEILSLIYRVVLPPSSPQYPDLDSSPAFRLLDLRSAPRVPNDTLPWGLAWNNGAAMVVSKEHFEYEAPRVLLNAIKNRAVLMRPFTDANVARIYSEYTKYLAEGTNNPEAKTAFDASRALGNLVGEYDGVLVKSQQPLSSEGKFVDGGADRLTINLCVDALSKSHNRGKFLGSAGSGVEFHQNSWSQIMFGLCEESVHQGNFWTAKSLIRGVELTSTWADNNTLVARPVVPTSIQTQVNSVVITQRPPISVKVIFAPGSESCVFELGGSAIQVPVPAVGTWYLFAYLFNENDSITIC